MCCSPVMLHTWSSERYMPSTLAHHMDLMILPQETQRDPGQYSYQFVKLKTKLVTTNFNHATNALTICSILHKRDSSYSHFLKATPPKQNNAGEAHMMVSVLKSKLPTDSSKPVTTSFFLEVSSSVKFTSLELPAVTLIVQQPYCR